jgi:tRNA pseudouridine32 synthase/23S rRNA pseudouridine746 synthase
MISSNILEQNQLFAAFGLSIGGIEYPERFSNPFEVKHHPLSAMAVKELKHYLSVQTDFHHNFGLEKGQEGTGDGKMFGVLVVRTHENLLGYLCAFSGKLAGSNHHARFVPPVFDSLDDSSFLNSGMTELSKINRELKALEEAEHQDEAQISASKQRRKEHSLSLSNRLYDSYSFLNISGEYKSLREIFQFNLQGNPPGGAGECAAPKLLQYAFQHKMTPLAMAEFWWGESLRTDQLIHGNGYPSCEDKCRHILKHMLEGIEIES